MPTPRFCRAHSLLCVVALFLSACGGASGLRWAVGHSRQQQGTAIVCDATITNAPDALSAFHWSASNDPSGALFAPASGSIAHGSTRSGISAFVPIRLWPVTVKFSGPNANYNLTFDAC